MVNELLVNLVDSVLGTGKRTARGNRAYHCPYCNHHKPKLEVNFTQHKKGYNPFHCWACDKKGSRISSIFKQVKASPEKYEELKKLIGSEVEVKKQDNQKKVFNHMKGYDEYLASSDTNQEILFKSFRRKLDLIKPELSAYEKIKTKLSSTASIVGTSLFIAGFLIARLTIPVSTVNIKGIEDQSYLEHLPTNIIEITSEKRFEKTYG